jgi:hypothetical protein
MKHLKSIFESFTDEFAAEVKDFAENCLAYLLDNGFEVVTCLTKYSNTRSIVIWIDKPGRTAPWNNTRARFGFEWDDVKDYYIPFVQLLASRYKLFSFEKISLDYPVVFSYAEYGESIQSFTYDQIVNDNLFMDDGFKTTKGFISSDKVYLIGVKILIS